MLSALVATALVAACGARSVAPFDSPPVTGEPLPGIVSSVIVPTDHVTRAQRVSGISGLAYDATNRTWIAVSDDRLAPRWFVCRFTVEADQIKFSASPPVMARPPLAAGSQPRVPDFEAVAVLPSGDLLIASEGERLAGRRFPASIMRFKRDGSYVGDVAIPERYLPSVRGGVESGMRDNHGFEGIALSADGSRLWAVAESPLLQDDTPADDRRSARTRLIELVADGDTFRAVRELVYPIDAVPVPPHLGAGPIVVDQGVAELTMLADGTLVSLERAFIRGRASRGSANVIRIFRLDLDVADDVSAIDSLRQAPNVRPISKTLLRDLTSVVPELPPRLATLENFEAMAVGPMPHHSSLVLMSDDNFSATQVTAALLLSLPGFAYPSPSQSIP